MQMPPSGILHDSAPLVHAGIRKNTLRNRKFTLSTLLTFSGGVTGVDINDECTAAVLAGENGYKGSVSVYNGSGDGIYRVYVGSGYEESSSAVLGKPVGSDRRNEKSTMLSLYGADRCRELVRELTERAEAVLREDFGAPPFLLWLTEELAGRRN